MELKEGKKHTFGLRRPFGVAGKRFKNVQLNLLSSELHRITFLSSLLIILKIPINFFSFALCDHQQQARDGTLYSAGGGWL